MHLPCTFPSRLLVQSLDLTARGRPTNGKWQPALARRCRRLRYVLTLLAAGLVSDSAISMTAANSENGQKAQAKTAGARFLRKFTVLKRAARELWITFTVKLLVIAAYAVTNSTLVLWLSSDLGYSDQNALRLAAAWSLLG